MFACKSKIAASIIVMLLFALLALDLVLNGTFTRGESFAVCETERFLLECPFREAARMPVEECLDEAHREFWLQKLGDDGHACIPACALVLKGTDKIALEEIDVGGGAHPQRHVHYRLLLFNGEEDPEDAFRAVVKFLDGRYERVKYYSGIGEGMISWTLDKDMALVLWLRSKSKDKWLEFVVRTYKRF